ncbi:MAG: hypothetical protein H8D22_11615 [Candidatus Cloacimonetes bacterium]|nr:hypothetical protein [Candidatus Cloacimonadota bacterium]
MKKQKKSEKKESMSSNDDPYLMRINKGEKLYKFFFFRPIAGRDRHFEYRILTKEKTNGKIEMVSYNFKIVNGIPQKSSIMKAPEVPKEKLEEIIENMKERTNTAPDEFEELDLSKFKTIDEQLKFLKKQDKVDTMYIM